MSRRWTGAPPEDAYGRVTDPGRFSRLHAIAGELLDELTERFDVARETALEPDPHSDAPAPVVRLRPRDPAAAPLTIVFTGFPGLVVRLGRTDDTAHLPVCGCDACDESVEDCAEELRRFAVAVTSGAYGERLVRDGGWWHEQWFDPRGRAMPGRTLIESEERIAELRAALPSGERTWRPWPQRRFS